MPCCNLAESFENNATVDVSYADAVTGIKQIQMLGLAGKYTQILRENMPAVRGLYSNYGLTFIPGSWLESIQISKGASSILNGYESISGQINTEFKKPEKASPLYADIYGNNLGRAEANLVTAHDLSDHWSSMLLAHGSLMKFKVDANEDSFLDMPLTDQVHFMNRWKYQNEEGLESQFGIRFLNENRAAGQQDFNEEDDRGTTNAYGIGINTRKYEAYAKMGFPVTGTKFGSVGSQFSINRYEQNAYFGLTDYTGEQTSFYANVIYNTFIKHTGHNLSAGFSFLLDDYDETLNDTAFLQQELVPGVFAQYTYSNPEKLDVILGFRADYHNLYGFFFTPRVHAKYHISPSTIIRASAGKGYRTPHVLAENSAYLASARQWVFQEDLEQEEAWNYGLNFFQDFDLGARKDLQFNFDYYRTEFVNQAIVDVDQDLTTVYVYNLDGRSYSNSFQAEMKIEPVQRFVIDLAYRWNDVKMTINNELKDKPLVKRSKGLLTLSYKTKYDKWKFDVTNQLNGKSRLPELNGNIYRTETESPVFYTLHAQISRKFKYFEVYIGSENLTNYKQKTPVVAAQYPFSDYFDTSTVWGPVYGTRVFGGLRFEI